MFDTTSEIVCIAGGTGIAPFLSFIDALEEEVSLQEEASLNRIRLLYSIKHRKDAIDLDILKSKVKKFKLFITREQHNDSINRRIQIEDIIAEEAEEYKDLHYYISGSKDFINNYKQLLQLKKVNNIYTDEWI